MAIQQVVPVTINLQGDGVSTIFKYSLSSLFAVTLENPNVKVLNSINMPSAVSASGSFGIAITAAMVSGKIQLTFASAPAAGQQGTVTINLMYSSQ